MGVRNYGVSLARGFAEAPSRALFSELIAALGVEAEGGAMSRAGSNFAGGYGVFGAESQSRLGSLAAEVVAGRRWTRQDANARDVGTNLVEPRLRAQFWLTPQLTFGAAVGASPMDRSWMTGLYLGVHSSALNRWDQ